MSKDTEHAHQVALMKWVQLNQGQYPELALLFAVPNGGARSKITGARLKAEGVRRGVPDLFLPVPRDGFHGLFIELKTLKGTTTREQRCWLNELNANEYRAIVCHGWEAAAKELTQYLRRNSDRAVMCYRREATADELKRYLRSPIA